MSTANAFAILAPIVPALVFFGLGWLGEAPGEWGGAALIAWTAILCALIAGAGLQIAGASLFFAVPVLGVAAIMVGGPPGLLLGAICAFVVLVSGPDLVAGRWLAGSLALLCAALAIRQHML